MLGYCNDGNCGISFGTYKEVKNEIVFNQKIYQAQDSCYYSQTKQYKGTYHEGDATIDLSNTTDIDMKNKQYELISTSDDILSKLWNQPIFKSYCGKL